MGRQGAIDNVSHCSWRVNEEKTYAIDIVLNSSGGRGKDPGDVGDHVEGGLKLLDTSNNGLLVTSVVEIGVLGNSGGETRGDGHPASGNDTSSEVLAESHGI